MHKGFCWGNLCNRDHSEDLAVGGKIILKLVLQKTDGSTCTLLICIGIRTGGRLL